MAEEENDLLNGLVAGYLDQVLPAPPSDSEILKNTHEAFKGLLEVAPVLWLTELQVVTVTALTQTRQVTININYVAEQSGRAGK